MCSQPATDMSSPATAPQVSASSLSFLSAYASTQRFRVGLPTAATLVAADATGDGEFVYFLRTEDAAHSSQNLYELCVSTGSERLLVAAADLVAVESMSDAERQLRERQRMTSKGLLSVQMRPNHRREMLLPYQAHLYLIQAATGRTTNLTANSRFEAFGPPSYVQFSPGHTTMQQMHAHRDEGEMIADVLCLLFHSAQTDRRYASFAVAISSSSKCRPISIPSMPLPNRVRRDSPSPAPPQIRMPATEWRSSLLRCERGRGKRTPPRWVNWRTD